MADKRNGLLDLIESNPHGWGESAPDTAVAYVDDAGNQYGSDGRLIAKWVPPLAEAKDPQKSVGDSLLSIAESPARLTAAFAGALSPYGSEGWQVPPAIAEPANALYRLAQNTTDENGNPGIPNPLNPENKKDATTLLETFLGGNATRGMGAVERGASVLSDTTPSLPGAIVASAGKTLPMDQAARMARAQEQGFTVPAYRGLDRSYDDAYGTTNVQMFSSDPSIAAGYAGPDGGVMDALLRFRNPLEIDASGSSYHSLRPEMLPEAVRSHFPPDNSGYLSTDDIVHRAAALDGYDGIHFRNIRDTFGGDGTPSSVYVPFEPANIRSVNAAFDPAKTNDAGSLFSDQRPSLPGAVIAGAEKNAPGFDVWHGSPHDFDKFDMSKIGTGEGAQAYGHGLYFADSPGVAKSYQDALKHKSLSFDGLTMPRADAVDELANRIRAANPNATQPGNAADMLSGWVSSGMTPQQIEARINAGGWPDALKGELRTANEIVSQSAQPSPGFLYQARINADPKDFLDWDTLDPAQRNALLTSKGTPAPGAPGWSYLDSNSRGAGDGTRNYVVTDPSLIEVLHKWRGDQQLYSDQLPSLWGSVLAQQQQDEKPKR